ncbi:hypothetical protein [uncultured Croceitalea sp.]|uniref:hypothetical protein n=1 Tax=uncultured Croceitalea sp. TaxID=1798908 RepID=UPI0033064365
MISSFFSKTKPVNYLTALGFVGVVYIVLVLLNTTDLWSLEVFIPKLIVFLLLLLTVFSVIPILKTNKLAEVSSLPMLFFALLTMAFLVSLNNNAAIVSNFLIVLGMDKSLSLKEEKRTKYKIFEAALLVFAASVFNEWALLFLIPIYIAIYVYCGTQLRNWLMPLAAAVVIVLLSLVYSVLSGHTNFFQDHYQFQLNTDFSINRYMGVGLYIIFTLVLTIIAQVKLANRAMGRILSLRILGAFYTIGIALVFLSSEMGMDAIIYTFFPAAIFFSNYFETVKRKRFKEVFLVVLILGALVLGLSYLIQ